MTRKKTKTDVSIVLLVYNGERYLEEVLTSIFGQETKYTFEVIAIDSGSRDGSLEILKKFPVKVHEIPNAEFGHGKTRNLGRKLSKGDYVVFLTQDATPANENWLENLVSCVAKDESIAGAYSRQLPRPGCNPCESRDISVGAPPWTIVKKVDFNDRLQKESYESAVQAFIAFSDVSSCVRRKVHERMPFNEELLMMEDQQWCKRAIEASHTVVYEAASAVYHSHNFGLKGIYRRNFEYGLSYKEIIESTGITFLNILTYTLFESLMDFFYILGQPAGIFWKLNWLVRVPLVRFAARYGFHKGLRA